MDPTIVCSQLERLANKYKTTQTGLLARVIAKWIVAEDKLGNVKNVLQDPIIQPILYEAQLSTDCGWDTLRVSHVATMSTISSHTTLYEPSPDIMIYCDGSCTNNGSEHARAGYGIYVTNGNHDVYSFSGRIQPSEPQTNQRAELIALFHALQYAGESGKIAYIYSDSRYGIDCLTKWSNLWETNGWRKTDNKPIQHLDIIQPMYELYNTIKSHIKLKHINGHTGNKGNDQADKLAREGALKDQ